MQKKKIILDLDGTLVDSLPFWRRLDQEFLASRGISPSAKELKILDTMGITEAAAYFRRIYHFPDTIPEIVQELNQRMLRFYEQEIPLKEGADLFLAQCRRDGISCGLATATDDTLARHCLRRLGVLDSFTFLLSCETLGKSKAFPDIYLEGARIFGQSPSEIAVFEDAPHCLETAARAGFYTVAVFDETYAAVWQKIAAEADESILSWKEALR